MKVLKYLLVIVAILVVVLASGVFYVKKALPDIEIPEEKIISSPERIKRGEYLANHVAVCIDCHSTRDWTRFAGPIVEGTEGRGGEKFGREFGFPGEFYSRNITPAAIGDWTDGELFRAVAAGVDKSGKALFPMMPYLHYGKLDKEDVNDILAYIRTLKPLKSSIPDREIDFPMDIIVNTIPEEPQYTKRPTDPVLYGEYLVNMAACGECHTPMDHGKPIKGKEFAGGNEFYLEGFGTVRSLNITPDETSGIGTWTKEMFIKRFKYYTDSAYTPIPVGKNNFNTIMPWTMYGGMTEDDLGAIYEYLRTVKPVKNAVKMFSTERPRKKNREKALDEYVKEKEGKETE